MCKCEEILHLGCTQIAIWFDDQSHVSTILIQDFSILVSKPQTKQQMHDGSNFDTRFVRWLSIMAGNNIGDLISSIGSFQFNICSATHILYVELLSVFLKIPFNFAGNIPCNTTSNRHEIHYSKIAFLVPFLGKTFYGKWSSYFPTKINKINVSHIFIVRLKCLWTSTRNLFASTLSHCCTISSQWERRYKKWNTLLCYLSIAQIEFH